MNKTNENKICKWKHLGGAIIAGCKEQFITDYGDHTELFFVIKTFNFCPFCGEKIELPTWMNKG